MSFNIEEFAARVGPPLRNNKFLVQLNQLPKALASTGFANVWRDLQFFANSVDTPGLLIFTNDGIRRYGYGMIEKKPYVAAVDDCRLTMMSDQDGNVIRFMRAWQASVVNSEFGDAIGDVGRVNSMAPYELGYKADYAVDVTISMFADDGSLSDSVVLREAWPRIVGPITLGWGQTNEFAQLPVSLSFVDFRTIQPSG